MSLNFDIMEKNKGFYLKKSNYSTDLFLYVQPDQFIEYMQQCKDGGAQWVKFRIYENKPGAKFSHNMQALNGTGKDHEHE